MQDYPPGPLKGRTLFSFKLQEKTSLPELSSLVSGLNGKERNENASLQTITERLPTLREPWKKQAGNKYAAEAYKEGTQLALGINCEL